jgi:hypothetical protein
MLSNYLAELWGILIVIISLALLIKKDCIKNFLQKIETNENLFFWGFVSLIIGLSMILSHNIWEMSWQVIITILGWLAFIKGLAFLFCPECVKKYAGKIENQKWLPVALVVLLFIGLVLTYLGFKA